MFGIATKANAMMATVLIACTAVTLGHAQSNDAAGTTDERLLACDELADAREKLACFDGVVESLKTERTEASNAERSATPAASGSSAGSESDRITEKPAAAATGQGDTQATADVAVVPAQEPADDPADDSNDRRATSAAAARQDDSGDGDRTVRAQVVRSWRNLDGRFSVELDNGQIWRETQGTDVGLPAEGDRVEISEGIFGGHRMKIEDITRIAWVRRAE